MVIVFVLFVLNTTQTNANKIQIKTLRRAEIIRIICQRGLGLFFTTYGGGMQWLYEKEEVSPVLLPQIYKIQKKESSGEYVSVN